MKAIFPLAMLTNLSVSIADMNFYPAHQPDNSYQELFFNGSLPSAAVNTALPVTADTRSINVLARPWQQFDYTNLQEKKQAKPYLVDDYITLYAASTAKDISVPKNDTLNMMLMTKQGEKNFYSFRRTGNRAFKISSLLFYDTVKVNCRMQVNKELSGYFMVKKQQELAIPAAIAALPPAVPGNGYLKNTDSFFITRHTSFNDLQTISAVLVKSTTKIVRPKSRLQELDEAYTSGFFRGNTKAMQFNLVDDTIAAAANVDLQQYLRYRVPGLVISNLTGRFSVPEVRVGNNEFKTVLVAVPVFIDENEMDDVDLSKLNTSDFAYVKYIPGIVIGSSDRSTSGAFYIYTKKGNEQTPLAKAINTNYLVGYNRPEKFTSPLYSGIDVKAPDRRTTLYWDPGIIMDKNTQQVKIAFYNNDFSKKMLLIVEGMNAAGNIIHVEKIIE